MYENYEAQTNCPQGSFAYVIKSGDTLFNLAIKYNTTVEAIMKINPGLNPNRLQIGQRICIPQATTPPPPTRCPVGTFAYTIKAGDTLYKLAITYNTTVDAIMRVNPGLNPNNLQIGQVICIPSATPPPTRCPVGTFAYTIRSGDTLYQLAITYNTTVEAIMAINPGLNPNNLQIGQVICIPRGTPPTPPCNGVYYVVRPGDTLFSIAQMYSIPLATLIEANPGVNPNNLTVGEIICIPRGTPPVSCQGGTIHMVRQNDTLGTLILRYNVSVLDLTTANPNVDFDRLVVGQQICIMPHADRGCPCGTGFRSYTIVQSDIPTEGSVVVSIAQRFNISVANLMKANQNLTPSDFTVGRVICVPM